MGPEKDETNAQEVSAAHCLRQRAGTSFFSGQVWPQEGECSQNGFAIATVFDYNVTWRVPAGFLCGLLVPGPLGDDPPLFPEFF